MKELEAEIDLLGSLSGVLDNADVDFTVNPGERHSTLYSVLRIIGLKSGINFKNPFGSENLQLTDHEIVETICIHSGVRWRKVRLAKKWYELDTGELLVFAMDQKPYAAIRQVFGYLLLDGSSGSGNKANSITLNEYGYVFYKGFGDGELSFRRLIKLCLKEVRSEIMYVIGMNALIGLLSLFLPIMIGVLFQRMLPESNISQLHMVIMGLLVSSISVTIFHYVSKYALLTIESKLSIFLQTGLWDRLLNQPISFFRNYSSGELTQRALGINTIRQLISGSTISSLIGSVLMFFYFILLLYYSVKLALISIVLIGLFSWINFILLRKELLREIEAAEINGHVSSMLVEHIGAISKIKSAAAEGWSVRAWGALFAREKRAEYRAGNYSSWVEISNVVSPIISSLVIYILVIYSETGISTGVFISFNATFAMFLAAGIAFSGSLLNFYKAIPIFKRLKPIVESTPVYVPDVISREINGKIEMRNVSFAYDNSSKPLLRGVNLSVSSGEFIGIKGKSGSGKSTLMKLILGFYNPQEGAVFIDGHDMSRLDLRSFRRNIGVVLQSDGVMQGSIKDNIQGAGQYTNEQIMRAVQIADLQDDIDALPMGLNTVIPHGGGSFSGGQLQRILIARAIVGEPKILIMDEATSALDALSQEKIARALDKLSCTRIVIAHRLSTLRGADRIYQLRDGILFEDHSPRSND